MTLETDCVIVGAGPVGLFQVFELGLLDVRAHVIDALPKPGGQCAELYPDKPIYDIPAYPVIGAQELVDKLLEQIRPFHPTFHLGEQVTEVQAADGAFTVRTSGGSTLRARAVVIAGGVGAFQPVPLKLDGIERFVDTQVHYRVLDPDALAGKHVAVLGGGDSALDWMLALAGRAASLTLIHRSEKFRAQDASVARMRALCDAGKARFLAGHVHGYEEAGGQLTGLKVRDVGGAEHLVPAQQVLVFFGLSPKLGPIAEWGLNLNRHQIVVDTEKFETSTPGIHAIGDISWYPGKKKLILCGFHEAALVAFAVKHRLNPDEKVHLQYTTTSPVMHQRLGVSPPKD